MALALPRPFNRGEAAAAAVSVPGFYIAGAAAGTGVTWGTAGRQGVSSGRVTGPGVGLPNMPARRTVTPWTFDDPATGEERIPRAALSAALPGGAAITKAEATAIVNNGLTVAFDTRGRDPDPDLNSNAEISVTVVDLDGNVLAQARTPDAPVFGADVSIQKARSVVYLSRNPHNPAPEGPGSAFTEISAIAAPPLPPSTALLAAPYTGKYADYVNDLTLGNPNLFSSGTAFSDRAIGDVSRPYYPDDIDGGPTGPA